MDWPPSQAQQPKFKDHRDCRTLTGLTFEHLPRDGSLGRRRSYPKGSLLWSSESTEHDLFLLDRGQVVVMLDDAAGCEVILQVIEPGQPFGELCFCSARDLPRENCAQAVIDSDVLQIAFDDFTAYLQSNSGALTAFTFTLCERLADAERRIDVLSHRGAEARLGRLLLQLAATRGVVKPDRQGEVRLPIGHDELARLAAMTRPHVSVTMSKLRVRRLVHYDRGTQLTINVASLSEYLGLQP